MNPGELLSKVCNHDTSVVSASSVSNDTEGCRHFATLCASFGLSLYEVTKSLNWIPFSIFLARRSRLFKMMMKVIPARTFELHIVLQSWNESSYNQVGRSYWIACDVRYRQPSHLGCLDSQYVRFRLRFRSTWTHTPASSS